MLKSLPQPKRRNTPWTPLQRLTWLMNQKQARKRRALAETISPRFPDYGISANGYNMAGNVLLLHFNGNLLDTSGYGCDVTPRCFHDGSSLDDIFYAENGVCFNWCGGDSEIFVGGDITISFWLKDSRDDPALQPSCNVMLSFGTYAAGLDLLLGEGVPFESDAIYSPTQTTWNITRGAWSPLFEFVTSKSSWHHYVLTGQEGTYSIHVDGALAGQSDGEMLYSCSHLRFGGWYDDSQETIPPMILLSEFAVFTRAWTAAEAAAAYDQQKNLFLL
jgi:hypothetical protein